MSCTRCQGTGFINLHQVPDDVLKQFDATGSYELILQWIKDNADHDVSVCDCCGDTNDWYGTPGEHNESDYGPNGPYAYNGGLPECY